VPSSARLVPAERLGAVTTITASHSGSAEVVLYDDATLSPRVTGNPDVAISGPGRLVGFLMTRSDGTGDALEAWRMPRFAGSRVQVGGSTTPAPTCTRDVTGGTSCTEPPAQAIELHEGYYHLAVLTDGGPVTIRIHFHGLAERPAAIRPQRSFRAIEVDLPERESLGATTVSYGGGQPTATGATAVSMIVAARLHPSAVLRAQTVCARADSNGAAPPYAYSPACPAGQVAGYSYRLGGPVPAAPGGGGAVFVFGGFFSDGPTGVGGSFVDTDGPTYVGGLGLWVWGEQLNVSSLPFS
jgi:hypothetical protein